MDGPAGGDLLNGILGVRMGRFTDFWALVFLLAIAAHASGEEDLLLQWQWYNTTGVFPTTDRAKWIPFHPIVACETPWMQVQRACLQKDQGAGN